LDLVGGLKHEFYFSIILGMLSSQLTKSYFSEGLVETTNQISGGYHRIAYQSYTHLFFPTVKKNAISTNQNHI
jgi:hypothetical protein